VNDISLALPVGVFVLAATSVIVLALAVAVVRRRARAHATRAQQPGRAPMESAVTAVGPGRTAQVWPDGAGPGSVPAGEQAWLDRRREALSESPLRPLSNPDRERYEAAWRQVQTNFVEDPRSGIFDADQLVQNVLHARGVRMPHAAARPGPGEPQGPEALERYWAGHDVVERRGEPNVPTPDLWRAMADFQAVLDALLVSGELPVEEPPSPADSGRAVSRSAS
jgi:hypothetical protein